MIKYEAVVIYSVKNGEEAAEALGEKIKALIEANGTIESIDVWGKRRLAYPINDEVEASYVLYNFESEPDFPAELSRVCGITDGILRVMTTKRIITAAPVEEKTEEQAEA